MVQHEPDAPPALLAHVARAAGFRLEVVSADRGDPIPRDPLDYSAVVVLGGSMDVEEAPRYPHLTDAMELIRATVDRGRPFLGICLGGQLAAEALGGRVFKGDQGTEIGWVEVTPTEEGRRDPVASSLGDGAPLFQWHRDVFEPPPRAVPILTGGRYGNQGFRIGSAWALQGHPEVDADTIAAWAYSRAGRTDLERAGLTAADILEGTEERVEAGRKLLEAWCRVAVARSASGAAREGGDDERGPLADRDDPSPGSSAP